MIHKNIKILVSQDFKWSKATQTFAVALPFHGKAATATSNASLAWVTLLAFIHIVLMEYMIFRCYG